MMMCSYSKIHLGCKEIDGGRNDKDVMCIEGKGELHRSGGVHLDAQHLSNYYHDPHCSSDVV